MDTTYLCSIPLCLSQGEVMVCGHHVSLFNVTLVTPGRGHGLFLFIYLVAILFNYIC